MTAIIVTNISDRGKYGIHNDRLVWWDKRINQWRDAWSDKPITN